MKKTKNNYRPKFYNSAAVKIHKKFESFPKAIGVISRKYKKLLPYFAYGNKPNLTATYRVIESHNWFNGETYTKLVVIQRTDTNQVYVVTEDSLYLKYSNNEVM